MSASSHEFHADSGITTGTGGSFDNISSEVQEVVLGWLARSRQRRQLARLDAMQLQDIGLTHAEAMAEASKPFWQE